MTKRHTRNQLRSGGFLWGPRRVAIGMSITDLSRASGINTGFLSRMENGVMIPSAEEFAAVMHAIEEAERGTVALAGSSA